MVERRVAVTGGRGFLGAEVCRQTGATPFDLRDGFDVCLAPVALGGYTHVIHLAGVLGTDELFDRPHQAVDVNIHGTLNVLEACRLRDVAYTGITMPSVWTNVYSATKGCSRQLASAWHHEFGVPVSHVRAFNVFGEGQKVHGVAKIVPTFASAAWRGEPIPIWGDGNQTVDLVYVGDVARRLVEALDYADDRVLDAGTGTPFTVNEVAQMVLDITGSKAGVVHRPMRRGEQAAEVCASGKGLAPFRYQEFERTVRWYEHEGRP